MVYIAVLAGKDWISIKESMKQKSYLSCLPSLPIHRRMCRWTR